MRDELVAIAADAGQPSLVRRRALESTAVFGALPDMIELIRAAYDGDDDGLRAGALYAMGRTLDRRWLNVLLAELESPDAEMRYEAARACGELGDASAVESLARCGLDNDAEVRQAAITALGRIGSNAAARALRVLAETARPADREAFDEALDEATSDDDL
ncbi:MAG: HEAT repeat domain-containing protein [Thermomicrobiales bacterium]